MTVAALLLAASAEEALTRIDGRPLVRRLVDAAWAGGAVPVVVAVADPAGDVAAALAGAPATLVQPGPGDAPAALAGAIEAAVRAVSETDAVMVWPTAYAWVDPETLTSLIEAHGVVARSVLRPAYDGAAGWPVLVPVGSLPASGDRPADGTLEEVLAALPSPVRLLDLGDPGTVHDMHTPRTDLPPYRGPASPAGAAHEWGSLAAEEPDVIGPEGPEAPAVG
ncbi:MAG: NTP transferase domain-containing protein [Candidatus Limnocylindrales bacterium]